MPDHTHYLYLIGDGHVRGRRNPAPLNIDPVRGQFVATMSAPSPAPVRNVVVRGLTSGALGRIIRVLDAAGTQFIIEAWEHPVFGVPGVAFTPGETLQFDNGGTALVSLAANQHAYPLAGQFALEQEDAILNSLIPEDAADNVWYDRTAKFSRSLVLDGATIGPSETSFVRGARFTTSAGASGTILLGNVTGSDYTIYIVRAAGTFTVGDVLTITATGHDATIKTVGADPAQGSWVPHSVVPNLRGTGIALWEFPPNGNGTDGRDATVGPEVLLLRGAQERFRASSSVADRGTRMVPFSTFDFNSPADAVLGGVTVQVVRCTGTFPGTWTIGETVSSGTWSGKVHGFSTGLKYLYVTATNGETLATGTVTGATSGASASATGPAVGWAPGSLYWSQLVAELAAAVSRPNALWMSSPARAEGALLMIWEAEVNMFLASNNCPWPDTATMQAAWLGLIEALRTHLARDDMPVALWHGDVRSHPEVNLFGVVPFALQLRNVLESLPTLAANVHLVRTDDFQPAQSTGLPYSSTMLHHRPQDYLEVGRRAWRAINLANTVIPPANFEMLPVVFVGGQSQQVGSIPANLMMAIDRNPDLWPSRRDMGAGGFPGVHTVDVGALTWNTITQAIEPLDVVLNANTFFAMPAGTCGPPVPLIQRQKSRWGGRVLLLNLAVSASSVNAACDQALATWDPDADGQLQTIATCTVTAFAASSMVPQRGRFAAAAGTFEGWTVGASAFVSGSAALIGLGGNNTAPKKVHQVYAVAGDGSWIELIGPFVNEGSRTFTLTKGPHQLWPLVQAEIRKCFQACAAMGFVPFPALLVWENGESDLPRAAQYYDKLKLVLQRLEATFGLRLPGQTSIPKVLVQLSSQTPLGTDAEVAAVREAQRRLAAELENCALVDPSDLVLESSGVYPRTQRQHNGVHRTAQEHVKLGFRVDAAASKLTSIPPHPRGESVAADSGAIGGDTPTDGADAGGQEGDASTDSLPPAQAAIAAEAIGQSLALQPDVAGYSVTAEGHSVQRRSLRDQIEALEYLAAQRAREQGLTHTLVDFT